MHGVSAVALDAGRIPGAPVVTLSGDLAAATRDSLRIGLRSLGRGLLRAGSTVLRRPRWTALATLVRFRPLPQLVAAARTDPGQTALAAPQLVMFRPATEFAHPYEHVAPARREIGLPADPTAPRQARALLEDVVAEWHLDDDLHDDAAMIVTELVANAVDHARTPSTLAIALDDRGLCVAVRDGRAEPLPRPRPVDPTAPRGRGLQMIAALATSWGVTTHADGKTVWALLPRA